MLTISARLRDINMDNNTANTANSLKFCKNCRHLNRGFLISNEPEKTAACIHPSLTTGEISLITGKPLYKKPNLCMYLRMEKGICGPEALLFSPADYYLHVQSLVPLNQQKVGATKKSSGKDLSDFM